MSDIGSEEMEEEQGPYLGVSLLYYFTMKHIVLCSKTKLMDCMIGRETCMYLEPRSGRKG